MANTELIIHIGLPRTGTTALQRQFFRNSERYEGIYKSIRKRNTGSVVWLKRSYLHYQRKNFRKSRIYLRIFMRLLSKKSRHLTTDNRIVISDEDFFSWILMKDYPIRWPIISSSESRVDAASVHPFPEFLQTALRAYFGGRLKIIAVTRSLPTYLASLYARCSASIPWASQADFHSLLEIKAGAYDARLDFNSALQQIAHVVGSENLLVLHYEDFPSSAFLSKVEGFVGIPVSTSITSEHRWSTGRDSETIWQLDDANRNRATRHKTLEGSEAGRMDGSDWYCRPDEPKIIHIPMEYRDAGAWKPYLHGCVSWPR